MFFRKPYADDPMKLKSSNVVWYMPEITRIKKEQMNGHKSFLLWFTGLPSSGKSSVAHATEKWLYENSCRTFVLDGDNVRHGLCGDLGFTEEDREENIRRVSEVAKLFIEAGVIVLAAFVSPFNKDRKKVKELLGHSNYLEIFIKCTVETCEKRDPKGLYKKARIGKLKDFTGVSAPFEDPKNADLTIDTDKLSVDESVIEIKNYILLRKMIYNDSNK
jgi:adenylylsulfate kinase